MNSNRSPADPSVLRAPIPYHPPLGVITWPRTLCESCVRFQRQDSHYLFYSFEHSKDKTALALLAQQGCDLCQLFVKCLNSTEAYRWQIGTELGLGLPVTLELQTHGLQFLLAVGCGIKIGLIVLALVSGRSPFLQTCPTQRC